MKIIISDFLTNIPIYLVSHILSFIDYETLYNSFKIPDKNLCKYKHTFEIKKKGLGTGDLIGSEIKSMGIAKKEVPFEPQKKYYIHYKYGIIHNSNEAADYDKDYIFIEPNLIYVNYGICKSIFDSYGFSNNYKYGLMHDDKKFFYGIRIDYKGTDNLFQTNENIFIEKNKEMSIFSKYMDKIKYNKKHLKVLQKLINLCEKINEQLINLDFTNITFCHEGYVKEYDDGENTIFYKKGIIIGFNHHEAYGYLNYKKFKGRQKISCNDGMIDFIFTDRYFPEEKRLYSIINMR